LAGKCALSGNNFRLVICVNEQRAGCPRVRLTGDQRLGVRLAGRGDVRAVLTQSVRLDARCRLGHEHLDGMAEFAPDIGDGEAGVASRCDREPDSGHVVRKYAVEHAARLETAGVLQELELQPESRRDLDDRGTTHSCGNALRRCLDVVVRNHATIMGRANGMSETRQLAGGSSSRLKRMTTTTKTFTARAIPADVVAELRARDDCGNPPEPILDRDGGSPLRCCLRSSEPGEQPLLASYAPLRRWAAEAGANPGPYLETGPVFIHAEP